MKIPKLYAQNVKNQRIDLTLSVNPLGCSPRVINALNTITMKDISIYPNQSAFMKKLAVRFRVKETNILLGNGSEQIIKLIAQTFISPKNTVLIERGSFGLFMKESMLAKGKVKLTTLNDIMNIKARLVFLANPKTPTGEIIPSSILQLIQKNSLLDIVVIDEANGEFLSQSSIPSAITSTNMLVLRTFSKTFGLAGLRLGFVIGPQALIEKLKNTQQAFSVSQIAMRLAQTALDDQLFLKKTKTFITRERIFLQNELTARGLQVSDSVTNNLFVSFPQTNKLLQELTKRDVSVINGLFFPGMQKQGFRISLKDRKTNSRFLKILDEAINCLRRSKLIR